MQRRNAFFTGIKASFTALAGVSWKNAKPAEAPFNVHWTFSQSWTLSLTRGDLMAIDMGRLKNKETIILPRIWERCIRRGFEGIHDRFLKDPVFRESQHEHDRTEEVCIQMDKTRRKISPIEWRKKSTFDTERVSGSLNKSGNTGPLRNRSDFNVALTTLNRLH